MMDALGTRHAARETGPRLSQLVFQETLLACRNAAQIPGRAELRVSTQIVACANAGVCNCLGKNKKTFVLTGLPSDNFATAFTVLLEE